MLLAVVSEVWKRLQKVCGNPGFWVEAAPPFGIDGKIETNLRGLESERALPLG